MKDNLSNFFTSDLSTFSYISPFTFVLNVILISFLSYLLGLIYSKFGKNLSNRSYLAFTFPLLGLATMTIITVVKSSLALSLGLVGALSIVRFRTPIKEPEELIYLFICLSLGLAVGADQRIIAILTLLSVFLTNLFLNRTRLFKNSIKNTFSILINTDEKISQAEIIKLLNKYCYFIDLKRYRGNPKSEIREFCFLASFNNSSDIEKFSSELKNISINVSIDIIDQSNVIGVS